MQKEACTMRIQKGTYGESREDINLEVVCEVY